MNICPNQCKNIPIGQRRKAGRPRLAVRAYLRQSFSRLPATLTRRGGLLLIDPIAEREDNDDDDDQDKNQIGVLITAAQPYSHVRGQGSRSGRGLVLRGIGSRGRGSRGRGSLSTESLVVEPVTEHEAVHELVY